VQLVFTGHKNIYILSIKNYMIKAQKDEILHFSNCIINNQKLHTFPGKYDLFILKVLLINVDLLLMTMYSINEVT